MPHYIQVSACRLDRVQSVMDSRAKARCALFCLAACGLLAAQEAPIPAATELSGRPYAIKDKWIIGGSGNWDYLTLDPVARQLFIAHQDRVEVVDIASGALAGEVRGFTEAHSVVLDPDGQFGYASDGRADKIAVFNRRTFQVEASISIGCSPRSMVFDQQDRILLAICGAVVPQQPAPQHHPVRQNAFSPPARPQPQPAATGLSHIVMVDTETRTASASLAVGGDLRIAQFDGRGTLYITAGPTEFADPNTGLRFAWPPRIAVVDVAAMMADARRAAPGASAEVDGGAAQSNPTELETKTGRDGRYIHSLNLGSSCPSPQGLAIDADQFRLFVACENQALLVLDSRIGQVITTLTTGPGTDAIAYDRARGLIFTANGGGYGSVTIVRQHLTDSYSVIQNLPTMRRAKTMAIDPSTGLVYLVTALYGANLANPPLNGIDKLQLNPIDGSFQVLVVGN
jgi:DNA-binding beta-propeller fold protein YncE